GGFGGGVNTLVTQKAVQEDIKATPDQIKKIDEWKVSFQEKANEIRQEMFKDVEKEDFPKKFQEVSVAIDDAAYKELGDVLKKDQIARLKQIRTQQMGLNAFANKDVASALKLTDAQKASVQGITGDFNKESREIMTEAGFGGFGGKGGGKGGKGNFDIEKFQEAQKKVQKAQKEYMTKMMDVLDDSQKKTWKELTGETFDLTKLNFGGGFGGKKGRKKD
ncbi:MAG TPA: Spy/CpxP family protein refolding chaperone, partial [Gemmata sp.]|nr:Spy/CpxP family protein refolding chaperone [Gemmata sp.]